MITPMDTRRKWLAVLGLVVFVITFVPVPFTTAAEVPARLPRDTIWLPVVLLTFYTFWRRRSL